MPIQNIGEFGTPGASSEWIEAEGKLAIKYVVKMCGSPPRGNGTGDCLARARTAFLSVIALTWEDPFRGVPSNYISRCEAALAAYENGGELPPGWTLPHVRDDDEDEDIEEEPFDPQKPPEPPDTLNFFEWQRSISKLIEWSLDYAAYQRTRPQLVEDDDRNSDDSPGLSLGTLCLARHSFLAHTIFRAQSRAQARLYLPEILAA
jgi:hypothetical protein